MPAKPWSLETTPRHRREWWHAEAGHLANGPYREKAHRLTAKYPNIKYPNLPYPPYQRPPGSLSDCRVAVLELHRPAPCPRFDFYDAAALGEYLNQASEGLERRRLFLVEGWDVNIVGLMSEIFDINPAVLVSQQRQLVWAVSHLGGNVQPLPTTFDPAKTFSIRYYEARFFQSHKDCPTHVPWRCAETCRYVSLSRLEGQSESVGIIHRKATFWSTQSQNGDWDAIIFLDPQVHDVFVGRRPESVQVSVQSEPYQGGYPDFMRYRNLEEALETSGPPRSSMLDDICYFWQRHSSQVPLGPDPLVATIFLKKIVASNYALCIEHVKSIISQLEYKVSGEDALIRDLKISWAEDRWGDLQAWNRRCSEYCESLDDIFDSFQFSVSARAFSHDWIDCEKDFQIVHRRLQEIRRRLELLTSSFTGLTGIVGNAQALDEARRSLHEAKSVRIITLLGMTFLPLSFTTGLLSMGSNFLPGASHFWLFFAIAAPLVVLVFALVSFTNRFLTLGVRPLPQSRLKSH